MSAIEEEPPSVQRNLNNAFKQITEYGFDPKAAAIAVDVDASARHDMGLYRSPMYHAQSIQRTLDNLKATPNYIG